ncbi:hypothetical protein L0128_12465 [candidate division KSB1 bacterium]|nr:hypothetical protein [candidate division KSB1 bacterium]
MLFRRYNWLLLLLMFQLTKLAAQSIEDKLTPRMLAYEYDIESTYSEYQKLYYEKKSSEAELRALEQIISVYVDQILKIHNTLILSGTSNLYEARDIAARALIFRALTHIEKAPLSPFHYELACYDYYEALELYRHTREIPVMYKPLPRELWIGNKRYDRLIDLMNEKGKELFAFGRVEFIFNNFKVTSDMNANDLIFMRFKSSQTNMKYTFNLAEDKIKQAFKDALKEKENTTFYLALPEGSYFIRYQSNLSPLNVQLATIYVRANQQQKYVVEPISDWIILYEEPSNRRPDFKEIQQRIGTTALSNTPLTFDFMKLTKGDEKQKNALLKIVSEIVKKSMEEIELNLMFDLNDPWFRTRFIEISSDIIIKYAASDQYYNNWSNWHLAWEIATDITATVSPGRAVSTEMIQLIHSILQKI